MEKVELPIKTKIAVVLLMITALIFIFIFLASMNTAGGYISPNFFVIPFIFIFSCLSFAILLLRRIKWVWYGALIFSEIYFFIGVGFFIISGVDLVDLVNLLSLKSPAIFLLLIVLAGFISLVLLSFDRKKYLEIASRKISPERKKMNILIIIILLIALGSGIAGILSIEEDPCRGRSCKMAIRVNLNGIRAQAELFYDNNGYRYSSANLTNPFVDECPELGDGNTMFAKDRTIASTIEYVREVGDGNINVSCYMSADAQSWALDVRSKNDYYENYFSSWCIDSMGNAKETTINPATGLCSE